MKERWLNYTRVGRLCALVLAITGAAAELLPAPAVAQETKPNILFVMGDDIGWMQPSYYHRGLMVGETPNIDRIGREGMAFTDYYAMQSCTSGRNAFFTGMYPLRTGMIPPQPVLAASRHAGGGQVPVRSRLHHWRVR
jgi:arylsulfatase